jgi:hypothetical protein
VASLINAWRNLLPRQTSKSVSVEAEFLLGADLEQVTAEVAVSKILRIAAELWFEIQRGASASRAPQAVMVCAFAVAATGL